MSELLSRRLFVAETLLIAAPLSLAYLYFGLGLLVAPALTISWWPSIAIGAVAMFALTALVGAWVLVLSFLRGGAPALRKRGRLWWVLALIGAGIVSIAFFSMLIPSSREYSAAWSFRRDLELFVLGSPLMLPFAHLVAERTRASQGTDSFKADRSGRENPCHR